MTTKEVLSQHSQNQRPRSAAYSERGAQQSIGKYMQAQNTTMDEKTVTAIWKGFGSYIAKQLRNGKGVFVPKFGNFTFSATVVDLAGTTNPGERDKQVREPVFIIGKDFVSGVTLRAGISHVGGGQIRPYDVKGASGIIPKVKINYTEVGVHCSQNKDICRNGRGENVQMEIPFVGSFIIRNNIAAIAFHGDILNETKGVTAKNHFVNKLFSSNVNRMNLIINDNNIIKQNPSIGLGGAMRLTNDAENWLKSNLNISVQELLSRGPDSRMGEPRIQSAKQGLNRYSSVKPTDGNMKSWAINQNGLTQKNKEIFDKVSHTQKVSKRPMSAYSGTSRVSNVPELGKMKLMMIATDIYQCRSQISEIIGTSKVGLRDVLTSSEIQHILRRSGIHLEIGHVKSLLRDLGFNWNGPSCTFVDLFNQCKTFVYGTTQDEEVTQHYFSQAGSPFKPLKEQKQQFATQRRPQSAALGRSPEALVDMVKDLFYSTRKSLYQIYTDAKLGQLIDVDGLRQVVQEYSDGKVNDQDIKTIFNHISKGKKEITYQEFEKAFKWDLPAGGQWETQIIQSIRVWMAKHDYQSEMAFYQLCKLSGNTLTKKMSRIDFHKAIQAAGLRIRAPEVDALFTLLDLKKDNELDMEEWKSRIYEDTFNPLQMLREIVQNKKLTSDDLLFQMNLKIWDNALDYAGLCQALRKLDSTLTDFQLRNLMKVMKNNDGKVEIPALIRNMCGQEFETADYRIRIFRAIYAEIHPNKEDKLMEAFEEADPLNDGRLEPKGLKMALQKVVKTVKEEDIDRFIKFLDKDKGGKINYMQFLNKMGEVSNKDHNPFKSVVQRLQYFIQTNQQNIHSLLKRISQQKGVSEDQPTSSVSLENFAQFMKQKIDKKRPIEQLRQYSHFMDIDKDGYISETDLQTCLSNLNSETFFKNGGEALASSTFTSNKKFFPVESKISNDRAVELFKQIRTALISQRIAYRAAFNKFDENKDGFLSFGEFSKGLDSVISLSVPVKEKLFAFMDTNKIGLIDFPNFLESIQLTSVSVKKDNLQDNFNWESNIIDQMKDWINSERITVEEAFSCFDKDFDGFISKEDLKWGLINILKVRQEEILPTKLDRLFRLLDFYKTNNIQLSDFQRLMNNENPYQASSQGGSAFSKTFGGGFAQSSTFDWKLSAIQQMGLVISKKYKSLKESFEAASQHLNKISYDQFKKFIEETRALVGFNLTQPLIQKLFSELDPHKKGYLNETDWLNAFKSFNWNDQIMIELRNAVQCAFTDVDSAFEFFITFKNNKQNPSNKHIHFPEFEQAVNSLTIDRFKRNEIQSLWNQITQSNQEYIDKYLFRVNFDNIRYTGHSTVRNIKTAPPGARTTIVSQTSSNSKWDQDIFEKLRQIIRTSSKSFEEIFASFDEDGNGIISQTEFRNAIRKLNLGLKSREIDEIMKRIDTNQDGKIDWREFISKFKKSDLDERLKERSKDKMARLKELMILYMTSPNDAFRFFDESKHGKLTYQEFSKLMLKIHELAGEKQPPYTIIKDVFDTIDIRKDGIIDLNEWQQTFGNVVEGAKKLTIKATPLSMWENTREFEEYGSLIARNRKLIKEQFDKVTEGNRKEITYEEAKSAILPLLQQHLKGFNDEKLKCVLRSAEIQGASAVGPSNVYDIQRILDIFKNRHAGPIV